MKKVEMREVTITYCDYCDKEITDHASVMLIRPDKTEIHLHSKYISETEKTCDEKFRDEEIAKARQS